MYVKAEEGRAAADKDGEGRGGRSGGEATTEEGRGEAMAKWKGRGSGRTVAWTRRGGKGMGSFGGGRWRRWVLAGFAGGGEFEVCGILCIMKSMQELDSISLRQLLPRSGAHGKWQFVSQDTTT
ncbi:UNVERIFIED_CONTAM: hypothetical protein Sradi_2497500 [Sesamum radiatum]|uniref:Uncharacterized protein n=1 Tax=Sesamum radiatum TaxID=300843 RepID=A0AAW2SJY8_SESRA